MPSAPETVQASLKTLQDGEFTFPPVLVEPGMRHKDAVLAGQAASELRKIFRVTPPVFEIINPRETRVRRKAGGQKSFFHPPAKNSDEARLEPGKPSSPQFGGRHPRIADVRPVLRRQGGDEFDDVLGNARQLVRVKVAVNVIRCAPALLNEQLILRRDLPRNFCGIDSSQHGLREKRVEFRKSLFTGWRRERQIFICETQVQPDVHLVLIRKNFFHLKMVASLK